MDKQQFNDLIIAYLDRTITESDMQLLQKWVNESGDMTDPNNLRERFAAWPTAGGDKEKAWKILLEKGQKKHEVPVRRIDNVRKYWSAAAAVLVIVVGTAIYFQFSERPGNKEKPDINPISVASKDAQPGSQKATLTLGNGSSVVLDSTASGVLAKQGNIDVVGGEGSLSYQGSGNDNQDVLYNTLLVPKGGQYRLLLNDGTKVWLNSASSIRYPTIFKSGMVRNVEVSGEVYFEVATISSQKGRIPFIVATSKGVKVEVLGTHFNINAYEDEQSVATTLLEGKVKVTSPNPSKGGGEKQAIFLQPGEQAIARSNLELSKQKDIDVQQVMAWKNGTFYFHNTDLASVMRQISRWYDVDIVYEGKIPEFKISGEASRSVTLAGLLSMFANTDVKSRIEGKSLIIPEQ
ncbi:MAG: FecR domain-containing protein [Chitinophagaceae bacterium]